MPIINYEYEYGIDEIVYLKVDVDRLPYLIVGHVIEKNGVKYRLAGIKDYAILFASEITRDKHYILEIK